MENSDEKAYQSLVMLLHETAHTPQLLDMVEDFIHAIIARNPTHNERLLEARSPYSSPIFGSFALYKVQIILPELGETWVTALNDRLQREEDITTAALIYDKVDINRVLRRLSPGVQLNDEIIDGYLSLIRIAFCNTKRYYLATTRLLTPDARLGPVDRLVNAKTLHEYKGFIIPVFQANHWTFAVLQYAKDSISLSYYDSFVSSTFRVPDQLLIWIQTAFSGINIKPGFFWGPQQRLGNDCGVIMLMGMRLIAAGRPHLSQAEADEIIPRCRYRILAELLAIRLDPKPEDYHHLVEREQNSICADSLLICSEIHPYIYIGTGDSSEDPITFDTPPTETPLSSTGNGEAFMGATLLSEIGSPKSQAQDSSGLFWQDQSPEFKAPEDLTAIIEEESIFRFAEPPTKSPSPKARTMKRKEPEPAEEIEEANYTVAHALSKASPVETIPIEEKPVVYDQPLSYAHDFSEEKVMIESLRQAVQARRMPQNTEIRSKQSNLAILWSSLEAEDAKPRILQLRHNRQQFSQKFLERQAILLAEGKKSQASTILKKEIGIDQHGIEGGKRWRLANAQAKKASIWTELSDIFSETLGPERFVALCAVSETTTTMEVMTLPQRQVFLERIRCRLADPEDGMVKRLKAASPLYSVLMEDSLPATPLQIETWQTHWPLHSTESFEEMVGLRMAPSRRALPARSQKYRS